MTNKKNTLREQNTIKKLYTYLDRKGFCVYTDDDYTIMYIHHGQCILTIEKNNVFNLSFEVCCDPTASATITQEVIKFATNNKYRVEIYEPFAYVMNEGDDTIREMLFGDEAREYYDTGEVPIKEAPIKTPEKEIPENPQKKVDDILDQISANGIGSLKENQKKFLLDIANENHSKHKG